MYLSQITLNPRSRQVRSELARPYEMHRTLMKAFPQHLQPIQATPLADDANAERVLFRLDVNPEQGWARVLVQSHLQPNWTALNPDYALSIEGPKPFTPTFAANQHLAFRLRANPTVKRNGKRWGLQHENEQLEWLNRKAREGGFSVLQVNIRKDQMLSDTIHRTDSQKHDLSFLSVQFDGTLMVLDPCQFHKTLAAGIGTAKGIGFGLLSLARL